MLVWIGRRPRLLVLPIIIFLLNQQVLDTRSAAAREEILSFEALIVISADGAVTVTEEITVRAEGRSIRRGIFRDIPLGGVGLLGIGRADFSLIDAERDGRAEVHRIESTLQGVRIYLGDPDRLLDRGVHRYRLVYRLADQLDSYPDYDELYWNVTGHDWAFPIASARATVALPGGAPVLAAAAYTGVYGSQESAVRLDDDRAGRMTFSVTRELAGGEGLTVAVAWLKGYVAAPSARLGMVRLLERYGALAGATFTLALVIVFYLLVWMRIGRDPSPGVIVPVYRPSLPPAAMRYIRRMGFDHTCLLAALLNLASKGWLAIEERGKSRYRLTRLRDLADDPALSDGMSDGERLLFAQLFAGRSFVDIGTEVSTAMENARGTLAKHFERTFNREYFRRNRGWFAVGLALTLAGLLFSATIAVEYAVAAFMVVWLGGWSFGTAILVGQALSRLTAGLRGNPSDLIQGAVLSAFSLPFLGGLIIGLGFLVEVVGIYVGAVLAVTAAANVLFYHLLKAPTALGRQALDEIEGTRLYLSVAEHDRLRFHNPPDRTPETFHAMLPYAVALDLETAWTEQFKREIEQTERAPDNPYLRPRWYRGSDLRRADFGQITRSLSRAVATASTPPSRSGRSGSGSGGFSGGGRGGGGW